MTRSISQLFEGLSDALGKNTLDARIIGGRFKLIIDSSAYLVDMEASPAIVIPTSPDVTMSSQHVDATITYATAQVFIDLYERKMSPQMAFIQGSVTMEGEMNAVIKIKRAFDILRREEEKMGTHILNDATNNPSSSSTPRKDGEYTSITGTTYPALSNDSFLLTTPNPLASPSSTLSNPNNTNVTPSKIGKTNLADVVKQTMKWKDTSSCEVCGSVFNFLRRRHHCRNCTKCICDNCSIKSSSVVRICIVCNQTIPSATLDNLKNSTDASFMSPISTNNDDENNTKKTSLLDQNNNSGAITNAGQDSENHISKLVISASDNSSTPFNLSTPKKSTVPLSSSSSIVSSVRTTATTTSSNTITKTVDTNTSAAAANDELINKLTDTVLDLQSTLAKAHNDVASLKEESAAKGAQKLENQGIRLLYGWLLFLFGNAYYWYSVTVPVHLNYVSLVFLTFAFLTLYLRFRPTHSFSRIIRAFYAVAVVLLGLRALRTETAHMSDEESEPVWDAKHRVYGRYLVRQLMSLRGLWVKVGQYLSSRADIVPVAYVSELAKLQDANPAEDFAKVQKMIEKELGISNLSNVFRSIEPVPLGSASIAQVHKGILQRPALVKVPKVRLRSSSSSLADTGNVLRTSISLPTIEIEWEELPITEVVVKIQHKGIENIMKQDFWTLNIIVRLIAYLEKEYDFRPVLDEWAKESVKELNFVREAAVTRHMAHITSAAQLRVGIPQVISLDTIRTIDPSSSSSKDTDKFLIDLPIHRNRIAQDTLSANIEFPTDLPAGALATRHLLITQFIDAQKITDTVALDKSGVDRTQLLAEICAAYAIYLHVEGVFSGDPHPANVLVDKQGKAWLIDYGLTKVLPPPMRLAFAAMVAAAQDSDAGALLDSFDAMGLKLSREAPGDDLDNMRFMLRDTLPPKEARSRMMAVRKVWTERIAKRKAAKLRKPVESWPADLLLYLRAGEILRGLGSSLAVRVRYMQIMANASVAALRAHHDTRVQPLAVTAGHGPEAKNRQLKSLTGTAATAAHYAQLQWIATVCHTIQPYVTGTTASTSSGSLNLVPKPLPTLVPLSVPELLGATVEARLYSLINSLQNAKKLTGIQIAVYRYSKDQLIDIAAGELGPLNTKLVTKHTLFNVFSATKGVTATLLHIVMDEYARLNPSNDRLTYDTLVTDIWPEFAQRAVDTLPSDASLTMRNLAESKRKTTIKHILTHSTGLQHSLPSDISMVKIADLEAMLKSMEEAVPVWNPGTATTYHYLSFGWLIAGVVKGIVSKLAVKDTVWQQWIKKDKFSIGRLLHTLIAEKLELTNEMFIGLPKEDPAYGIDSGRLAILSGTVSSTTTRLTNTGRNVAMPMDEMGNLIATTADATGKEEEKKMDGTTEGRNSGNMIEMLEAMVQRAETEAKNTHPLGSGTSDGLSSSTTELSVAEARRTDMKALLSLITTLRERIYLFDPRLFNRMLLRQGEIPAANGHFTARALAKFYSTLGSNMLLKTLNESVMENENDNNDTNELRKRLESNVPILLSLERLATSIVPQVTERQQANVFVQGGSSTNWGLGYQLFGHNQKRDYRTVKNKDDKSNLLSTSASLPSSTTSSSIPRISSGKPLWGRVRTAVLGTNTNTADANIPGTINNSAYSIDNIDERGITEDVEAIVQQTLHPRTLPQSNDTTMNTIPSPSSSKLGYVFGHSGLGGSLAFADPQTGIGIAILVNQLAADKSVTASVLRILANEYNLPSFASY